ncbi:hypothetical protein VCHC80A1_00735 [Vibrio cholerae HC-80A1]|nr:hypothetical protein VCHC80A1_00735 [Vibrio cholerae HC-80A1]KKP10160.1 hypothetical protein VS84_02913 [Vibrio cholerae]KKP19394.1 hypothetical protein VS86_02636 [Vibrio cholerae]
MLGGASWHISYLHHCFALLILIQPKLHSEIFPCAQWAMI